MRPCCSVCTPDCKACLKYRYKFNQTEMQGQQGYVGPDDLALKGIDILIVSCVGWIGCADAPMSVEVVNFQVLHENLVKDKVQHDVSV